MSDELVSKIKKLKNKRNAVILAHNYQSGEVQDIADFVGDSLDLSRRAAAVMVGIVVASGVLPPVPCARMSWNSPISDNTKVLVLLAISFTRNYMALMARRKLAPTSVARSANSGLSITLNIT